MQLQAILVVSTFAVLSTAQGTDASSTSQSADSSSTSPGVLPSNFPSVCGSECQDFIQLSTTCGQQNNNDDNAQRQCICNGVNAQSQATSCAACAKVNGQNDNNSDLANIMNACGWNYAGVAVPSGSASSITSSGSGSLFSSSSGMLSTTASGTGGGVVTSTGTGGAGGVGGVGNTGGAGNTGGGSSPTVVQGVAPAMTAAFGGVVAGLAAVLPALM
ncbi:Uu.00g108940.m01.CDS01 [Anthostomella pinea]|uniref:Uu.00g108940.m01.CDS01 n=1 Tax=Anthostomella pinea TaxID=933095 RepID=A0AAI8V9H0_9PEZI|nr:Uu.00g108940.m01.CDS01 [Anthostomella pinea]